MTTEKMAAMYRRGDSLSTIAKRAKMTPGGVSYRLHGAGIKMRKAGFTNGHATPVPNGNDEPVSFLSRFEAVADRMESLLNRLDNLL